MSLWRNGNNGGADGSNAGSTVLDLQLRLAQPTGRIEVNSGNGSGSSSSSSCVSSDISSVLVLGGCKRCWRYCMVSKELPICINCKQPCFIGFNTEEKHG
ncbi:hypothetical protein ZEAMMB73_Zm00001d016275 [Zea mays]|uniref:Uncharacterized protein n=1 Tax=Zea mays TaxID=4577 RepID=A0A1D6H6I2_MAIZE|nr:hypothetical protein ZEAMMB73_Zm00001d016275 [Zea mays]